MPTISATPFILTHEDIHPAEAEAVLDSAVVAQDTVCGILLEGSGAVSCAQGITTSDIEGSGDGAFIYGATLTPKGMIISDMWISRMADAVTLYVPQQGFDDVMNVLRRSVPPRLARITDVTHDFAVFRVVGPLALEVTERAGFAMPDPGLSATCTMGASDYVVSRPAEPAPFAVQIAGLRSDIHDVNLSLEGAGASVARTSALELARVVAGWPRLGAEIDGRTLPQEVRFDELNGVSYTKGCYTGQETVARLHFRGHANRGIMGLSWEAEPNDQDLAVVQDNEEVGYITSKVWLDPIDQHIGLAMIKHKADRGEQVTAGGAEAALIDLPFYFDS